MPQVVMAPKEIAPATDAAAHEARWTLPVYAQLPVEPVRGDGVKLFTRDGRELIDFYGGHAVALLGYGHPRLLEALSAQAKAMFFQSNLVPLEVRARAAEKLASFAPAGLSRAFLVNSGAEANENALRLAFRKTGRKRVVALKGSFHGRTAAAAAVTWGAEKWAAFPRHPFDVEFVPPGDLEALAGALASRGGDDQGAAALILEPVQGMAGAVDLGASYLSVARELTREAGAALIFDEVQCGMGRTGQPFAAQLYGVTPDLLTTAKGLAGGFPAAAVMVSDDLAAGLKKGDLGTTFGGGPLACALIEATITAIEEEDLLARVRRLSKRIAEEGVGGVVTGVQGAGFLLGLRCARPASAVQKELLDRGLLAGTSADPAVLRLLPPLVLEDSHVDALVSALQDLPGGAG